FRSSMKAPPRPIMPIIPPRRPWPRWADAAPKEASSSAATPRQASPILVVERILSLLFRDWGRVSSPCPGTTRAGGVPGHPQPMLEFQLFRQQGETISNITRVTAYSLWRRDLIERFSFRGRPRPTRVTAYSLLRRDSLSDIK